MNTHAQAHTRTNDAHSLLCGNCLPWKNVEILLVAEYSTSTKVVFFVVVVLLLFIVTKLCLTLCGPWNSPGQNTGVASLSLLQRIFPTQGSNLGLPHCRQVLYQLSNQGSLKILEWVAYTFSRGSSWTRNQTRVSYIAGRFFTNWAMREAPNSVTYLLYNFD